MTYEDFQITVRRKTGIDKYWYYLLCIAVIVLGLLGFFWFSTHPVNGKGTLIIAYAACLAFLMLGSYGLYLLPNRYKIVEVPSELSMAKKQNVVSRLIADVSNYSISQPEQYIRFNTKSKWWQSSYNVHFFYDNTKFAFSVQGHDFDGVFIDFGGTERKRKLIAETLRALTS